LGGDGNIKGIGRSWRRIRAHKRTGCWSKRRGKDTNDFRAGENPVS